MRGSLPMRSIRSAPTTGKLSPPQQISYTSGLADDSEGRTRSSSSSSPLPGGRTRARTSSGGHSKRVARHSLAEALESHDVKELRNSISLARQAGVPQGEVVDAIRMLDYEVNKEVIQDVQNVMTAVNDLAGAIRSIEERTSEVEMGTAGKQISSKSGSELGGFSEKVDDWLAHIIGRVEQTVWEALQARVEEAVQRAVAKATQELSSVVEELKQCDFRGLMESTSPTSDIRRRSAETASQFSSSSDSEYFDGSGSARDVHSPHGFARNLRQVAAASQKGDEQHLRQEVGKISLTIPALPPPGFTREDAGELVGKKTSLSSSLAAFLDIPDRRPSMERAGSILRQRPSLGFSIGIGINGKKGSNPTLKLDLESKAEASSPGKTKKPPQAPPTDQVAPWHDVVDDIHKVLKGDSASFEDEMLVMIEGIPDMIKEPQNWGIKVKEVKEFYNRIRSDLIEYVEKAQAMGHDGVAQNLHVVTPRFIKPWTEKFESVGLAVVMNAAVLVRSKVTGLEEIMTARVFVSHCWNEDFGDFVRTMTTVLSPEDTVWVCAISICQNVDIQGILGDTIEESPFWRAMPHCRRVAMLIDRKAEPFERAWCALEEYLATYKLRLPFAICMPDNMDEDAWCEVDRKLQCFSINQCKASQESDKRKIMEIIADKVDIIDRVVRDESTKACFAARVMKVAVHGDLDELDPLAFSSLAQVQDGAGRSILHVCAQFGRVKHLDKLAVHCGLNGTCAAGKTPLHYAAEAGKENVVSLIIQKRAIIDARDQHNWTPLALAANTGKVCAARCLVRAGAEVDPEDNDGYTPLMTAAHRGFPDVVNLLLESNACLEKKDRHGHTALTLAAQVGEAEVLRTLATNGAAVDVIDVEGCTALMYAAGFGHFDATQVLIESRANLSLKDSEKYTALALAEDGKHDAVANLLRAHMEKRNPRSVRSVRKRSHEAR